MARLMKMEKDGIVREVVPSAFYKVWAGQGWKAVADDTPEDPHILDLAPGQSLEDYKAARDKARQDAEAADQARLEAIAEAERLRVGDAAAAGNDGGVAQGDAPPPAAVAAGTAAAGVGAVPPSAAAATASPSSSATTASSAGGDVQASGDSGQKTS